ncbi:hypothetical protein [Listeria booriae]|uniref:hypothetical protein n=1 Tax=Listeria booriae TaxID=1552123 RepID=UPI001625AFEC|nr:hypothetical protein [Listeria booriae]MBC2148104.1 hypothetical protein [Listeria booriae]
MSKRDVSPKPVTKDMIPAPPLNGYSCEHNEPPEKTRAFYEKLMSEHEIKNKETGCADVITADQKSEIIKEFYNSLGTDIPLTRETDFEDFKSGDIVGVYAWDSFCGMPQGYHQGIVVDLKGEEKPVIAFTDIGLAVRADEGGTWQFLNFDAWGNCRIILLYRCNW